MTADTEPRVDEPAPRATGAHTRPPDRYHRPSTFAVILGVAVIGMLVHGHTVGAKVDPFTFVEGMGELAEFLAQAFPPDLSRLGPIVEALIVTAEMALLGTILGGLLSLPLAVLAARNTTPHRVLYLVSRSLISLFRTVP